MKQGHIIGYKSMVQWYTTAARVAAPSPSKVDKHVK